MADQQPTKKLTNLAKVNCKKNFSQYEYLLSEDESVELEYEAIRDMLIFTSRKIIAIDVQGFTGSKKDFLIIPYSKATCFSVETAGTWDFDAEFKVWSSGIGFVEFNFRKGAADMKELAIFLSGKIK